MRRILSYFKLRPDPRITSLLTSSRAECGQCAEMCQTITDTLSHSPQSAPQDDMVCLRTIQYSLIEDVYNIPLHSRISGNNGTVRIMTIYRQLCYNLLTLNCLTMF